MASTRWVEFTITTGDGTSSILIEDRRIIDFPIEANITTNVEYNLIGTPVVSGNLFDGRILWSGGQFLLTLEEYLTLMGITRRQENQRYTGADYTVTFDNVLYPFVDKSNTRTRAIATGGVTVQPDGTIYYFARHNVAITKMSTTRNGGYYQVTLDWQELSLSA